MHSDQCEYCGKWVCHKPLLGTMHFCVSPERRMQIDQAKAAMQAQKDFIARQERLGKPFEEILSENLWQLYQR